MLVSHLAVNNWQRFSACHTTVLSQRHLGKLLAPPDTLQMTLNYQLHLQLHSQSCSEVEVHTIDILYLGYYLHVIFTMARKQQ